MTKLQRKFTERVLERIECSRTFLC